MNWCSFSSSFFLNVGEVKNAIQQFVSCCNPKFFRNALSNASTVVVFILANKLKLLSLLFEICNRRRPLIF